MEEQKAIRGFLGDRPDAAQLREWRETLQERLRRLVAARAAAPPEEQAPLDPRIAELRRQIAALEQEEMITEFVEDSVRVTLAMGSVVDGEREDAD
jgi:hypothetical protein